MRVWRHSDCDAGYRSLHLLVAARPVVAPDGILKGYTATIIMLAFGYSMKTPHPGRGRGTTCEAGIQIKLRVWLCRTPPGPDMFAEMARTH